MMTGLDDFAKWDERLDLQHYAQKRRSHIMGKAMNKDIIVSLPTQTNDTSDIHWTMTTDCLQRAFTPSDSRRKEALLEPKRDKPVRALVKPENLVQDTDRQSKCSLSIKLEKDFARRMNLSTQSLDGRTLFVKTKEDTDPPPSNKHYASTGSLDAKLKQEQQQTPKQSAGNDHQDAKPVESTKPGLSRKSHSSRNLSETKGDYRRQRRSHSVRDLKVKNGNSRPQGESQSLHIRRSGNQAHSSTSPKIKSPRKSIVSTRQLELGAYGQDVAVVHQAPSSEAKETRKTMVVRRKVEGDSDNKRINKRQSSRRLRQNSVRQKKELNPDDDQDQMPSTERQTPLRAPSGGADLPSSAAAIMKDDDVAIPESKVNYVGTVRTVEGLTVSEHGAENELSPRNGTMHNRSGTSMGNQRSPRQRVRHRVRSTELRQLGKQNARQVFKTTGKTGVPLNSNNETNLSDESSMSDDTDLLGPSQPPAQFEIALQPLYHESPTTTRPELLNQNGRVSTRIINATKSPFKVAGKLFKKAHSTAAGETEYRLPGCLPLDEETPVSTEDAIKTIEAIGITSDQIEMLKRAGLRITPT